MKLKRNLLNFKIKGLEEVPYTRKLAKSISIEAAELLEHFQWGNEYDVSEVAEELADVLIYSFYMVTV